MEGWWLISYAALWMVVFLLLVLVLGLAREIGTMRLHTGSPGALASDIGLALGTMAPEFTAPEVSTGQSVRVPPGTGQRLLLLFVSPSCIPCRQLLPVLARGWDGWQQRIRLHVVSDGTEEEINALRRETSAQIPLIADPLAKIRETYGNPPTPFGYVIDQRGAIQQKGIVNTGNDVDRLIEGHIHFPTHAESVSTAMTADGITVPHAGGIEEAVHG